MAHSQCKRVPYEGISVDSHVHPHHKDTSGRNRTLHTSRDQWQRAVVNHRSEEDKAKWTFVQRLLAIEEAHDKRKQAWGQGQEGASPLEGQGVMGQGDPGLRWIHAQVLEDEDEDILETDVSLDDFVDATPPDDPPYIPAMTLTHDSSHTNAGHTNVTRTNAYHTNAPSTSVLHLPTIHKDDEQRLTNVRSPLTIRQISREGNHKHSPSDRPTTPKTQQHQSLRASNAHFGLSVSPLPTKPGESRVSSPRGKRKRPMKLPPILLPRVYTVRPRPLQCREFLKPTHIRGPISDGEWEDLKDCRYIRERAPRFSLELSHSNTSLCTL